MPTNGILQMFIESLVQMTNDRNNPKYFFPNFLPTVANSKYVPYSTDMNVGALPSIKQSASDNICLAGWAGANNLGLAIASDDPTLQIEQAVFYGLNNLQITNLTFGEPTASKQYPLGFTAKMNAYADLPGVQQLWIDGKNFAFSVTCCTTSNLESCDGKQQATVAASQGTFKAYLTDALFDLTLLLTFLDDLTVTIEIPETSPLDGKSGLFLYFDQGGGLQVKDITFPADAKYRDGWEKAANRFFGSPQASEKILAAFNAEIAQQGVRDDLATGIEQQINDLINSLK